MQPKLLFRLGNSDLPYLRQGKTSRFYITAAVAITAAVIVLVAALNLFSTPPGSDYGPGPIGLEVTTTKPVYAVGEEVTFIIGVNNSQGWQGGTLIPLLGHWWVMALKFHCSAAPYATLELMLQLTRRMRLPFKSGTGTNQNSKTEPTHPLTLPTIPSHIASKDSAMMPPPTAHLRYDKAKHPTQTPFKSPSHPTNPTILKGKQSPLPVPSSIPRTSQWHIQVLRKPS